MKRFLYLFYFFLIILYISPIYSNDNINNYFSWLYKNGFENDCLSIKEDSMKGGYGVFANRNIMKGEEIIRIPANLVLNRRSIIRLLSTKLESLENNELQLIEYFREAIVNIDNLSNHTNNDAHLISFLTLYELCFPDRLGYKPWIDILPKTIDNLIHFSHEELQYLKGSELYERTLKLKFNTETFWNESVSKVAKELFIHENRNDNWDTCFSLEQWKWAMSIVSSRATFVPEQGLSIVHMAEIFNHKTIHEKHRPEKYIDDNGDFVIIASQIYPINTQIFFDYLQPNSELLLRYGFMDDKCKRDSVGFVFGLDPNDLWYERKLELLTNNQWQPIIFFPLEIQPSKEFMFYLRLFSSNEEELVLLENNTMDYFHKRISERNEQAACRLMEKIAIAMLNQYPKQDHPLEGEEEEIIIESLSHKAKMAYRLAKIEQRILKSMIDYSISLFPHDNIIQDKEEEEEENYEKESIENQKEIQEIMNNEHSLI